MRWKVLLTFLLIFGAWLMWRGGKSLVDGGVVLSATTDSTLEQRVISLENRVYNLEKRSGVVKTNSSTTQVEKYVNLNGGSASGGDWERVEGADFWLDTSLYGTNVEVSWQGWVDNGFGYVRLYDNSNHRAVDGSEILVNSSTKASFYSGSLSIWRGHNQYFVEVKSPVSGMVTVSNPRLKIVVR